MQDAHHVADDRATLLARLSAVTAGLFEAELAGVASQLVRDAQRLGALPPPC